MLRLLLPVLSWLVVPGSSDELPISNLALFSQAQDFIQGCLVDASSSNSATFDCPIATPAACLCISASISYRVVTSIRSCITDGIGRPTDLPTATQIWADYCSTNAGVSAQDETLIQNLPLYSQAGGAAIEFCATAQWSTYSENYGCDFVTPAPCLCQNTATSFEVANAIMTCVYDAGRPSGEIATASAIWNSYCAVNLESPATRSLGALPNVDATTTNNGVATSNGVAHSPGNTFIGSTPTSGNGVSNPTNAQSSQNSGGAGLSAGAIAGITIAGLVVAVFTAWVAWKQLILTQRTMDLQKFGGHNG